MNTRLLRTTWEDQDFKNLVKLLDAELKIRDGEDHDFYHQFNNIDVLKHVVVLFHNEKAVACGAIKAFDDHQVEVKRMYVLESERGNGFARKVLTELEVWAKELNYTACILETGINQPEAIALYKKCAYSSIENYGQYTGVATSFCFKKLL